MKKLICAVVVGLFSLSFVVGQESPAELKLILATPISDTVKVATLEKLAHVYANTNADSCIHYANQTIKLANNLHLSKYAALAHLDKAMGLSSQGNYEQAIASYIKSEQIFKARNDSVGIAAIHTNLSGVYRQISNYPKALEHAFTAVSINERLHNLRGMVATYNNIGSIYFEIGEDGKGEQFYKKAQALYLELGDSLGYANNLGNLARIYQKNQHVEEAIKMLHEALAINKRNGNLSGAQINYSNLGIAYHSLKEYSKALTEHRAGLRISKKLKNLGMQFIHMGNMGEVFAELYQVNHDSRYQDSALHYLKDASLGCKELSMMGPYIEFSNHLSKQLADKGKFKEAFQVLTSLSSAKDSIFNEENKVAALRLESQRELELKEKNIELKQREIEIANLELQNTRKKFLIYIGLLAITLLLAIRFIYWFRIKLKIQTSIIDGIAGKYSHDIRGPVSRLIGLMNLLESFPPNSTESQEIRSGIKKTLEELDQEVQKTVTSSRESI